MNRQAIPRLRTDNTLLRERIAEGRDRAVAKKIMGIFRDIKQLRDYLQYETSQKEIDKTILTIVELESELSAISREFVVEE